MRISDWSSDVCSSDLFRHPAEYYTNPENSIGYLARIVFRSFSRLLERSTLEHDVSAGQWRFLRQLWREDGITQRELSERVGMREPTTVVALKGWRKPASSRRSEEHTSGPQAPIRHSYSVFCMQKKNICILSNLTINM